MGEGAFIFLEKRREQLLEQMYLLGLIGKM